MSSSIPKEGIPEVLSHEVSTDDNETHENNNNNIITKPENINEMPNEMLISILARLSPLELLTSVSLVCKKWRECVHTVCLTKPVTLVFYGNYYKLEPSKYSVYHTESKQALNFYDVPFASDSCALYRPFSRLCLSPQSLNFENITELVFCGEYKHFVRSINAENFREFIQKYCKNLTHLKLLGANLSWECLRTATFEFDFQSTIWRVLDQIQLTTLRHVSISSNQRNCMLGAESLLPKLTQFYFEWSIDFMPSLRLLNAQSCTSIGIYWQGQQEYAQIKFNLTQLREQLPTIWQRISRINDRKINRHTFKPERAIVNLINPQSLRYLQLHINMCSDYVALVA